MNSIIIIFFSVFFSRSLVALGFPGILNHLHYLIVLIVFLLNHRSIINTETNFKSNVLLLFFLIIVSSFYNFVSISNLIIYSLIILEPFLVILIILSFNFDENKIKKLTNILIFFAILNTFVAIFQYLILGYRVDFVQGIFLGLGTGAHTTAAFSATAALYLYFSNIDISNLKKILLVIFLSTPTILGSANQIILIFTIVLSFYLLYQILTQKKLKNFYIFLVWCSVVFVGFNYVTQTQWYSNVTTGREIYDIIDAIIYKYKVFAFLSEDFDFFNYLIGLGPGHGTSRLALMIPNYSFLDFSSTGVAQKIISIGNESYLNHPITGSSIFSLVFFAPGLYGEIGLLGSLMYLYIWIKINKFSIHNKIVFIFIMIIIALGSIYQWPEEPAFMIYISSFIAIQIAQTKTKKI